MADENENGRTAAASRSKMGGKARGSTSDVPSNLRTVGIDTDRITEAAGERVSELQGLLIDEVRARPMRALAWAAAVGAVFGFWAAR